MFGFAYALNPFYRQICEALGINVLTQKDGTVNSTRIRRSTRRAGDRRVRRQCARPVAFPSVTPA
jgi:cytochrome c oxidase assembly protein Cox11